MRYGTIECSCGQQFYFESMATNLTCINCGKDYDISEYPEVVDAESTDVIIIGPDLSPDDME